MNRIFDSTALLVVMVLSGACATTAPQGHSFALMGDAPYSLESISKVEALITDVNTRDDLAWVLHVGDTKGGSQPCTDEILQGRFDLYQGFDLPFVFTPGDNDWFDCIRTSKIAGTEYERLDFVRKLYFERPDATTGAHAMDVMPQSESRAFPEFVENAIWHRDRVVYATVHLLRITRPPSDSSIAARRLDAALAWIEQAFDEARSRNSVGVFLATQMDPWALSGPRGLLEAWCEECVPLEGLEPFYETLIREAGTFDGQVVLAVGDTHIFRVDKPLYRADGTLIENFTRLETFGEPDVHWVRVVVDPNERSVFSFHQEIVPGN